MLNLYQNVNFMLINGFQFVYLSHEDLPYK